MIIIPMAGLSRRFFEAGFQDPKYMLKIGNDTVFDRSLESFRQYFSDHQFLFIGRENAEIAEFVAASCRKLGISHFETVILPHETAGQAETVELGIIAADVSQDTPLTIFNIDTFRPNFREPPAERSRDLSGWLEVFEGSGANWSYVRPLDSIRRLAAETAEKRPISNLCCTGLYHFSAARDFREALQMERRAPQAPELYVAPLYNHLIAAGHRIGYELILRDEVIFCGTPDEYRALIDAQ